MITVRLCATVAAAALLGAVPALASEIDQRIVSAAQNSYVFKNYLKEDSVKIDSKEGVVTLSGTVRDAGHKTLAQDTAENLPGVQRVDNQIQVQAKDNTETTDAWLSTKVKGALLFHKNVSGVNTKVYVQDGIATLQGEVASESEKQLAEQYAKEVEGIKGVKNELTVKAPEGVQPMAAAGDGTVTNVVGNTSTD